MANNRIVVDRYLNAPTQEAFYSLTKPQLFLVAQHFNLPVPSTLRKDQLQAAIINGLRQEGYNVQTLEGSGGSEPGDESEISEGGDDPLQHVTLNSMHNSGHNVVGFPAPRDETQSELEKKIELKKLEIQLETLRQNKTQTSQGEANFDANKWFKSIPKFDEDKVDIFFASCAWRPSFQN